MAFNPQQTYVHLAGDGRASEVAGASFWELPPAEIARYGQGWLISEFSFTQDWPTWEMHPQGDEFVYLLSGAVEVQFEREGEVEAIVLEDSGAVVVPRGVWHTVKVRTPCRMLHVTRGEGTLTRPV